MSIHPSGSLVASAPPGGDWEQAFLCDPNGGVVRFKGRVLRSLLPRRKPQECAGSSGGPPCRASDQQAFGVTHVVQPDPQPISAQEGELAMARANSFKFVMLPPQTDTTRDWGKRLAETVPEAHVNVAEDADTAAREILDADAAFGWLGHDLLSKATKLRWLQAPQAAPAAGYYYPELIAHPLVVTNFREIFNDHISAHILAFVAGVRTRTARLHPATAPPRVEEELGRGRR